MRRVAGTSAWRSARRAARRAPSSRWYSAPTVFRSPRRSSRCSRRRPRSCRSSTSGASCRGSGCASPPCSITTPTAASCCSRTSATPRCARRPPPWARPTCSDSIAWRSISSSASRSSARAKRIPHAWRSSSASIDACSPGSSTIFSSTGFPACRRRHTSRSGAPSPRWRSGWAMRRPRWPTAISTPGTSTYMEVRSASSTSRMRCSLRRPTTWRACSPTVTPRQ